MRTQATAVTSPLGNPGRRLAAILFGLLLTGCNESTAPSAASAVWGPVGIWRHWLICPCRWWGKVRCW